MTFPLFKKMAIVYFVPTDFARGRVVVVNAVPVLYIVKKWLEEVLLEK